VASVREAVPGAVAIGESITGDEEAGTEVGAGGSVGTAGVAGAGSAGGVAHREGTAVGAGTTDRAGVVGGDMAAASGSGRALSPDA